MFLPGYIGPPGKPAGNQRLNKVLQRLQGTTRPVLCRGRPRFTLG